MSTESLVRYRAVPSPDCRIRLPSGTDRDRRSENLHPGPCLQILGREVGIIPDFRLTVRGKAYDAGGALKGRMGVLVDGKGRWRAWVIHRVVGVALSTRLQSGTEVTTGLRTQIRFELQLVSPHASR